MLTGMDTDDFLSSLLEGEDTVTALCPSHSPLGSDSGISDDSSTANNTNPLGCPSPQGSDTDIVLSPCYSDPAHSDPAGTPAELQAECAEALTVQADHCYSLPQSTEGDMDALQSVKAENPDTDVFIDLGVYNMPTVRI